MGVKLVCGCGYLGKRVAIRWLQENHEVWATTRSSDRATQFAEMGLRPILADLTQPISLPTQLSNIDTVLFAVGFDRAAGQSIHEVYVGGLKNLLGALPDRIGRFLYISSTGVFDQSESEWVDEDSPCHPVRPGGQACLAAEQLLASHVLAPRRIILRLAGIYGPGRFPKLESIRAGHPLATNPDGFLNLIHVEDAVATVAISDQSAVPPKLYLVSDGAPVLRGDFYRELARLLKTPSPTFVPPSPEGAAGRAGGDKRVCSRRMHEELRVPLQFPTYREGLKAIVDELRSN